jgi:hypothetical protein
VVRALFLQRPRRAQRSNRGQSAAAPDANETISDRMPAFRHHGRSLVPFAAYKGQLQPVSCERGGRRGVRGRPGALLLREGGRSPFSPDKPLSAALAERIVKIRVEEVEVASRR